MSITRSYLQEINITKFSNLSVFYRVAQMDLTDGKLLLSLLFMDRKGQHSWLHFPCSELHPSGSGQYMALLMLIPSWASCEAMNSAFKIDFNAEALKQHFRYQ